MLFGPTGSVCPSLRSKVGRLLRSAHQPGIASTSGWSRENFWTFAWSYGFRQVSIGYGIFLNSYTFKTVFRPVDDWIRKLPSYYNINNLLPSLDPPLRAKQLLSGVSSLSSFSMKTFLFPRACALTAPLVHTARIALYNCSILPQMEDKVCSAIALPLNIQTRPDQTWVLGYYVGKSPLW